MDIKKAVEIFKNINSGKYSKSEKIEAIEEVRNAGTYTVVSKSDELNVIKWLFDRIVQEDMTMIMIGDAVKHCKEVVKTNGACSECANDHEQLAKWLAELKELKELREKQTLKWIPVTYHEPTDEEREYYGDIECILDCPLPTDGQEVIISIDGKVSADICRTDSDGYCLDSSEDWRDVDAWMPLPEPYEINSKIDSEVKIWHE